MSDFESPDQPGRQPPAPQKQVWRRPGRAAGKRPGVRPSTLVLVAVFLVGLCLLLYPTVSDMVNERNHSRAIASHQQALEQMDDGTLDELLAQALEYNTQLAQEPTEWFLSDYEMAIYNNMLDPFGNGMMGYLEIPGISVRLPIYHGVDAAVLQVGVGHVESSSLPVGGESSHCVLSGHRGLPSARLLSDLDQMEVGDVFYLHVLDQTLAYTVDEIRVVEPQEVESLGVQQGQDLCTLVTCTPYGVNTHRLLVRGVRTEYTPAPEQTETAAQEIVAAEPRNMAPVALALGLVVLLVVLLIRDRKKNERSDRR
ncbi:MAG TPA: class C sortase [Candidatus Fournierella merdigallinarum]|nr:class C sortase [Candidatus Fournierella merdigallinarum]